MSPPEHDQVDRAHLSGRSRPSPPIYRYPPSAEVAGLVDRYWIPVWAVSQAQRQSTLQYPVCLLVVSNTYARFYGPARGLSSVTLEGTGWAVGTMFLPAAGGLLWPAPMTELVDRYVDLAAVDALDADQLVPAIHAAMATDPHDPEAHRRAIGAVERAVRKALPVDEQGRLVNEIVAHLREHPELTRVAELARRFAMSERTLHRLVEQRIGLTSKWLIQRRRLHDAVFALKLRARPLADLAAELGYTDQAHFTNDFKAVTGMTPGDYLADQPGADQPEDG